MASQSKSRAGSKSGMSAGSKSSSSRSTPAKRGFAAMSPEKQRQIASMGGKAAHEKGTAHDLLQKKLVQPVAKVVQQSVKTVHIWRRSVVKVEQAAPVPRLHVRQRAQEAKGKTGNEPCLKTGLSVTGSSRYSA